MTSPEVRRGDFVYRDTFFAEVGENKRHPRASIADIRDQLLPKKGSIAAKDNVGHWYEAQLLHYGLPRTKEKNTAKMRLLQAVTQGSLVVPAHIARMEAEMKNDYAAAGRRAKAEAKKANQRLVDEQTVPKTKKRKQDGGESKKVKAASTKICVTVGDITFNIDHHSGSVSEPSAKKQRNIAAVETTTKSSKLGPKAEQADKEGTKRNNIKSSPNTAKSAETAPRKKQTARKSTGPIVNSSPKIPPPAKKSTKTATKSGASTKTKVSPSARPKQTARRSQPLSSTNLSDMDMTDAPPPYEAHDFESSRSHTTPLSSTKSDAVQISGYYAIDLSGLDFEEPYITLRIDHRQDKLWGQFDIGDKTGIIMVNGIDSVARGEETSFGWRSRNEENGSLRFGRGCDGRIEFDGHSSVRGVFYGIMEGEDVSFEGVREHDDAPEPGVFEQEWNDFPGIAYGRR